MSCRGLRNSQKLLLFKNPEKKTVNLAFRLPLQSFFWVSESQNKNFTVFLTIRYLINLGHKSTFKEEQIINQIIEGSSCRDAKQPNILSRGKKVRSKEGSIRVMEVRVVGFFIRVYQVIFTVPSKFRKKETFELWRFELWSTTFRDLTDFQAIFVLYVVLDVVFSNK